MNHGTSIDEIGIDRGPITQFNIKIEHDQNRSRLEAKKSKMMVFDRESQLLRHNDRDSIGRVLR